MIIGTPGSHFENTEFAFKPDAANRPLFYSIIGLKYSGNFLK
jgi:hypothetical protein